MNHPTVQGCPYCLSKNVKKAGVSILGGYNGVKCLDCEKTFFIPYEWHSGLREENDLRLKIKEEAHV